MVLLHVFSSDPGELVRHQLILLGGVKGLNIILKYII